MNLNAVKKRVEALEQLATIRNGDFRDDDILSPRDACFLISEQRRLEDENSVEGRIMIARISDLLARHQRAIEHRRPGKLDPAEAHRLVKEAGRRDGLCGELTDKELEEIKIEKEEYRRQWLTRLGADREYIKEVIAGLDTLRH